jgi:predicted ester cyclase
MRFFRVKLLPAGIVGSLVVGIFALLSTPAHAGSRMSSTFDFAGTFIGSFDGRRATVKIEVFRTGDINVAQVHVQYSEGGKIWNAFFTKNMTSNGHILENFTLFPDQNDGRESKTWKQLYLHTWNTDWISGINLWNGREFGMMFVRVPSSTPPLSFSGRRMVSTKDFAGCYKGSFDGHPDGRLEIDLIRIAGSSTNFYFSVFYTDSAGHSWYPQAIVGRDDTNDGNIIPSFHLLGSSGQEDIYIDKLYLHTWDIQFLSGISSWHGSQFGLTFTRVSC